MNEGFDSTFHETVVQGLEKVSDFPMHHVHFSSNLMAAVSDLYSCCTLMSRNLESRPRRALFPTVLLQPAQVTMATSWTPTCHRVRPPPSPRTRSQTESTTSTCLGRTLSRASVSTVNGRTSTTDSMPSTFSRPSANAWWEEIPIQIFGVL